MKGLIYVLAPIIGLVSGYVMMGLWVNGFSKESLRYYEGTYNLFCQGLEGKKK